MSRWVRVGGLLGALLSAGCAGRSPAPALLLGDPGEVLAPGRYTRPGFAPPIAFTVGEGWTAQQVAPGFFDVQQEVGSPHVIAVQFANVTGSPTAAGIAAAIRGNGELQLVGDERAEVAGREAIRITLQTRDPVDTDPPIFRPVLTVTAGPIGIASGRRLRIDLIDTPAGPLGLLVGGSIERWERALELAGPVVESVEIGAS